MWLLIVCVIIIIITLYLYFNKKEEHFLGAITQLNARGPIDARLTGATDICCGDPLCMIDERVKKSQNCMFQ